MTDKELFEKTEKIFNLNENKVERCYKKGNFKKILNERGFGSSYRGSRQIGGRTRGGGLLGGLGSIARGIGNVAASPFKLAGAVGRGYRNARADVAELNKIRQQAKQAKLDTKIKNQAFKQSKNTTKYGVKNSKEDLRRKQLTNRELINQEREKTNQARQTSAQAGEKTNQSIETTNQARQTTAAQRDKNKQTPIASPGNQQPGPGSKPGTAVEKPIPKDILVQIKALKTNQKQQLLSIL